MGLGGWAQAFLCSQYLYYLVVHVVVNEIFKARVSYLLFLPESVYDFSRYFSV